MTTKVTPNFFFGALIASSTIAHIKHLSITGPGSYAAHIALNEFYTTMPCLVDNVIESYQGSKCNIVEYDEKAFLYGAKMSVDKYLIGLKEIIEGNRYDVIPKELTNIHSELDNVVTLIDSTIYKLKFLS